VEKPAINGLFPATPSQFPQFIPDTLQIFLCTRCYSRQKQQYQSNEGDMKHSAQPQKITKCIHLIYWKTLDIWHTHISVTIILLTLQVTASYRQKTCEVYDNKHDNYRKNSSLGEVRERDELELLPTVCELLCNNGNCVVFSIIKLLEFVAFPPATVK